MPTLEERVAALEAQTPRRSYTSMWSGEEIDRRLLNAAGRNLLDNAYWAAKEAIINQRGKLEYTGGYGIDRWHLTGNGGHKIQIQEDGIVLTSTAIYGTYFVQTLDPGLVDALRGRTVTVSLLVSENSGSFSLISYINGVFVTGTSAGIGLLTFSMEIPLNASLITIQVGANGAWTCKLKASKLELGPISTLAHKDAAGNWVLNDPPPDYGVELLKCMRYLQKIVFSGGITARFGNTVSANCNLPIPMRANPTILNPEKFYISDNGGNNLGGTINPAYTNVVNGVLSASLYVPNGQDAMTYGVTIRSGPDAIFCSSEL